MAQEATVMTEIHSVILSRNWCCCALGPDLSEIPRVIPARYKLVQDMGRFKMNRGIPIVKCCRCLKVIQAGLFRPSKEFGMDAETKGLIPVEYHSCWVVVFSHGLNGLNPLAIFYSEDRDALLNYIEVWMKF